jgi:GNAT superfamily N-acetyltransferase
LERHAPSSPFDAQAALEHLLARLRASAGATRVSVWVHEASTDSAVPFRSVTVNADDPVFASVRLAPAPAAPAAVARGVRVEDWLVVTAVTVDEQHRRRGLATAVMTALGAWARERGARSCLLQVASSNEPALQLYERLGFTEHHRYHYRLGAEPAQAAGTP